MLRGRIKSTRRGIVKRSRASKAEFKRESWPESPLVQNGTARKRTKRHSSAALPCTCWKSRSRSHARRFRPDSLEETYAAREKRFRDIGFPPARLNITESAWFLSFTEHEHLYPDFRGLAQAARASATIKG